MAKKEVENKNYFEDAFKPVTRGELSEVLEQVLGQVDNQLKLAFNHQIETTNVLDVVVQALVTKGLICDEDLAVARETILEASSKLGGENNETN